MFKKVFEYAGPHKKDLYIATFIVLLSVLMGVLPFVLAYQVISPLVMGNAVDTKYVCMDTMEKCGICPSRWVK